MLSDFLILTVLDCALGVHSASNPVSYTHLPKAAPAPAAPAVPADGLTAEVRIAILAALQQEPGFDLARVSSINIRRI